jgi:hypothetical protein
MGCYPLFTCQDWSQLHHDLERLGNELVALSLVTDPFGEYDLSYLERCFDMVLPFKEHFVIDLHRPVTNSVSKHHQYYAGNRCRKFMWSCVRSRSNYWMSGCSFMIL